MQSVETNGLSEWDAVLAELLEQAPTVRRQLHEELSLLLKQEVDSAIGGSGLHDSHGKIRRWQISHIGSGGGYAAIRPAGQQEGGGTGSDSAGAITNYVNSGHKIRKSKSAKAYRSRIHVTYVNGYHFYQTATTAAQAKAIRLAEQFADKLAAKMGG